MFPSYTYVKPDNHVPGSNAVVVETNEGEKKSLPADTAIMAFGSIPLTKLADSIFLSHKNVRVVGDVVYPRLVGHAVREGFAAAWALE